MGASLTEQRRVGEEGLRVVKPCLMGRSLWIRKGLEVTVP